MIARRALLLAALATTGCASLRDPAPGRFRVGDGLTVRFDQIWSDFTPGDARKLRLLSKHGPALDRLYLVGGLRSGEGVIDRPGGAAVFRGDAPSENMDAFVAASVDALGFKPPVLSNPRPSAFDATAGRRCDIATFTGDGLAFSGAALYATHREGLSMILYLAAREHYFAAGLPEVEALMSSARLD